MADDGSSDGVEDLIAEYSKFMDIKHVKQEDKVIGFQQLEIWVSKQQNIIILLF